MSENMTKIPCTYKYIYCIHISNLWVNLRRSTISVRRMARPGTRYGVSGRITSSIDRTYRHGEYMEVCR